MRHLRCIALFLSALSVSLNAQITVQPVAHNAVRIRYAEKATQSELPDWIYVKHDNVKAKDLKVDVDQQNRTVLIKDKSGQTVFQGKIENNS